MSFAKPRPINPASKFISLNGDNGKFYYYKKPETEEGEGINIEVPLPIKFVVVDELSTITGFNKQNKTGVYSNEIHNIKTEILSVRLFKGKDSLMGKYQEIKGSIQSLGGKYAKSVYAMMITGGEVELVNFKVKGSFLNAWIEAKINTDSQGILIEECVSKVNGKTTYFEPVVKSFTPNNIEKTRTLAKKFLDELNTYFKEKNSYYEEEFVSQSEAKETIEQEYNEPDVQIGTDDDLPF